MDAKIQEILNRALSLDREDRCDIVDKLIVSMDSVPEFWNRAEHDSEYSLTADEIALVPQSHYEEPFERNGLSENAKKLLMEVLALETEDKILLHHKLIASLRLPDKEFDEWTRDMLELRIAQIENEGAPGISLEEIKQRIGM
ncbi:MAG: hypothetical protein ACRDF4_09205 [Rhabdochlamydiaceae bacterium]